MMLKRLDLLEGHPDFYTRQTIQIQMDASSTQSDCLCYLLTDFNVNLLKLPLLDVYNHYELNTQGLGYNSDIDTDENEQILLQNVKNC